MTSHYTWGSMTILHDIGGVLGRFLDNFFWTLKISWSWISWLMCEVALTSPSAMSLHHAWICKLLLTLISAAQLNDLANTMQGWSVCSVLFLLAMPCGKRPRVDYQMGQSLVANQNWSHRVLVAHSSSGVQLQVMIDENWPLKWATVQPWSNNQPQLVTHRR